MFTETLSAVTELWKEPKCPSMDEWLKKMWYICYIYIHTHAHAHAHNGILLGHEKNEILPFATTHVELESRTSGETNQREKDTHMISLIFGTEETKQMSQGEKRERE